MKTLSKHLLTAAVLSAAVSTTSVVHADIEVDAAVGVSNLYLFRGSDLGDGSAAVWGDLSASVAGAYAGIWASSGDDALGTEYDLYAGYGGELAGFSYDIAATNFIYPDAVTSTTGTTTPQGFADYTEAAFTIGYGPLSFTHVKDITAGQSIYRTLSYEMGDYSVTYGDFVDAVDDHVDLSYAYNDNLSFTVSLGIDSSHDADDDARDPLFVIGLSLPIE